MKVSLSQINCLLAQNRKIVWSVDDLLFDSCVEVCRVGCLNGAIASRFSFTDCHRHATSDRLANKFPLTDERKLSTIPNDP